MKLQTEPSTKVARILIIEDQEIVSEGLRLLLDQQAGLTVIGIASNGRQAVLIARQEQPDVALLDINLGDEFGLNSLAEILSVAPGCRILILTGEHDSEIHYSAIIQGAVGVVRKSESYDKLIQAVRSVWAGEVWVNGKLMARLLDELRVATTKLKAIRPEEFEAAATNGHGTGNSHSLFGPKPGPLDEAETIKLNRLTDREREVIQLIGLGLRNQQIADRLYISVITVRHHLSSIFNKLDVGDRFELAIYAYRHGLAQPPI